MMPFAALALGASLVTVATGGVPTLKVETSCKAAGVGGLIAGRTVESCLNDERGAHEQLGKEWSTYSADDKSHCLSMVMTGGDPSYVELLSCLEMSRDAKKIAQERAANEPLEELQPAEKPAQKPRPAQRQPRR